MGEESKKRANITILSHFVIQFSKKDAMNPPAMLDIKEIRDNTQTIKTRIALRGGDTHQLIDEILKNDNLRRKLETEKQSLQSERKAASKNIGTLIAQGTNPQEAKNAVKAIGDKISQLEAQSNEISSKLQHLLMSVPNTPHEQCPEGEDESQNPQTHIWGTKPEIENPLDHVELSKKHQLIDFDAAATISGSGFAVYKGQGARLERALINFLLDTHTQHNGYSEVIVPHIIRRHCMEGTGQLPKFEDDMYGIEEGAMFLAPTAEVPVTNLYRETLLSQEELPIKMCAQTPCFRREAGSAGRDNKGIIRMHQFNKVELVQIVSPERSFEILEDLTAHAQGILEALGLHYRTIELCTGDLGFSACKTYDIEVWAPGQGKYLEVSSCSNFGDYQARRMKLRFKDKEGNNRFCHTLNGSGTALPRLYVALLEQYQQADGSILIPEALQPYFGADSIS